MNSAPDHVAGGDSRRPPYRLAYLVTHPIQYQAPLLARIASDPEIDLKVFFCSDFSTRTFRDTGFDRDIAWDVPLLDGYAYEFLPALGSRDRLSFWRPLNYGLARRLRAGRFDALWVHGYGRAYHLAAILAARAMGVKVLVRDEANELSAVRGTAKRVAKRAFFAVLRGLVHGFLAIGSLNRAYYRRNGIPDERIFAMPYAVDNDRFRESAAVSAPDRDAHRRALGLEPGRPVILFASKLIARKRVGDLIEAHARLGRTGGEAPPYLLIVGDGEKRAGLEREALERGTGAVRFLGFKGQGELPALFDLADVFVLPSESEPWGLVVNEAMNAGLPVVVSDRVGCGPDLVRAGENGYLFPARDVAALSDALRHVLADRETRASMGRRSLEIVSAWGFEEDIAGLKAALGVVVGEGRNAP